MGVLGQKGSEAVACLRKKRSVGMSVHQEQDMGGAGT